MRNRKLEYIQPHGGRMQKVKMNLGGRVVEAERMTFKAMDEPWSLYRLEDGSLVKLKSVVSEVFKLPIADPVTGFPQIIVRSSNIISVEPPEPPLAPHEVN
jgi:hypothetical protein